MTHLPSNDNPRPRSIWRRLEAVELLLIVPPVAIVAYLAGFIAPVANSETFDVTWPWVESLQVKLSFRLDGLSLLFALLISGVGALILLYSSAYFRGQTNRLSLYGWLLVFMAAMLGLVFANSVVTLFVFWELTSVASYMLIGFKHEDRKARAAALQALLVTGLGGLALLTGFLLLGRVVGSYELTVVLGAADQVAQHPLATPIVALILLGVLTKSAQFPFHFWLPNAMAAPTPVSAYLHSATMVKAGVYLVARLTPLFGGVPAWGNSLLVLGGVTALLGALFALAQVDLKRVLAYSTLSVLGALMLLFGMDAPLATKAALVLLISHTLYKCAMFLIVGAVDQSVGSRDVTVLGKLAYSLPLIACCAVLAATSMAGLPPTLGFLAKELTYEATLQSASWVYAAMPVVLFANIAAVAVATLASYRIFFGGSVFEPQRARVKVDWRISVPPLLLSLAGVGVPCFPDYLAKIVDPALRSIHNAADPVYFKLWHGFTPALMLSVLTLVAGVVLYGMLGRIRSASASLAGWASLGPAAGYEGALAMLKRTATWQTRLLQNGRLRVYLLIVLATFCGLIGAKLFAFATMPSLEQWTDLRAYECFIPLFIVSATLMAVLAQSRLAAVCALGVIGYAVAMLFAMFSAPDLAMTQFAIETLTVILFVFVIYRLPRFAKLSGNGSRMRDAIIATGGGAVMSTVVLFSTTVAGPSRLKNYFVEHSLASAKGENMVNVILADFRALDTLGEITVLAVAAIGIYSLMRLRLAGPLGSAVEPASSDEPREAVESAGQLWSSGNRTFENERSTRGSEQCRH